MVVENVDDELSGRDEEAGGEQQHQVGRDPGR
jgi:hypothetical protein